MYQKRTAYALMLLLIILIGFSGSTGSALAQDIGGRAGGETEEDAPYLSLELSLTPYNPPTVIPASGGVFQFAIDVQNQGTGQATFDVWTSITLPDGSQISPAVGPFRTSVPAGWSSGRDDQLQDILATDPAGDYIYTAHVGRYPNHIRTSASFTFEKLPGGGWFEQSSGTSKWLFAVDFADPNNGWAVGQTNTVLHTSNGGDVWTAQSIPVSSNLQSVFALDSQHAWAGGDLAVIVHTNDGGANWVELETGFSGVNRWEGIFFLDENNGWVVGGKPSDFTSPRRVILHTTDGGQNWQVQYSQSGEFPLKAVHFVDADNGWAVGEGLGILHTANGGLTWEQQSSGVGGWLDDVYFTNANNGWAVGRDGRVVHTTNGGATWVPQNVGVTDSLNALHFVDGNNGWITGWDQANQQAVILRTSNGGQTWNTQDVGATIFLADIVLADVNQGWAVGNNGRILHTDTGGE